MTKSSRRASTLNTAVPNSGNSRATRMNRSRSMRAVATASTAVAVTE